MERIEFKKKGEIKYIYLYISTNIYLYIYLSISISIYISLKQQQKKKILSTFLGRDHLKFKTFFFFFVLFYPLILMMKNKINYKIKKSFKKKIFF